MVKQLSMDPLNFLDPYHLIAYLFNGIDNILILDFLSNNDGLLLIQSDIHLTDTVQILQRNGHMANTVVTAHPINPDPLFHKTNPFFNY